MTGAVVARPPAVHTCAPGWTYREPEHLAFLPPDACEYPAGTVWLCECGQGWVSTGPIAPNSPGFIGFRKERRRERRGRERRSGA